MKKIILLLILFFVWKHYYYVESAPDLGAVQVASGIPFASETEERMFRKGDFSYYPRASYEAEARVLNASRYYFDRGSRLSPMAITLGWEEMSDETISNQYDFTHHERGFGWDSDNMPLTPDEVKRKTGNIHIIPANETVRLALKKIKIGDLIEVKGLIVDVKSASGWKWRSTHGNRLANGDSNNIIFTKSLTILNPYERIY